MRAADGPVLLEIERHAGERFREVGLDSVADDDPGTLDELAGYAAAGRGWVAVDRFDTPVGYVVVDVIGDAAHIEQVTVHPDHQGTGVGRTLIDRAGTWARANDLSALTLTTFANVPWNRPLYEHLGFRVLRDDEIGALLRSVRDHEATLGLDPTVRVCMRRDLDA
jgi:GNAT superfamily N-acetyltransferase